MTPMFAKVHPQNIPYLKYPTIIISHIKKIPLLIILVTFLAYIKIYEYMYASKQYNSKTRILFYFFYYS